MKNHAQKLKPQINQKQKVGIKNGHKEKSETHTNDEQKLETQIEHQEELIAENENEQTLETQTEHQEELIAENENEQTLETQTEHQEELTVENKHEQNLEFENEYEQKVETEIDDEQKLETQNDECEQINEIEQSISLQNDNEEKDENDMSADELNENDEVKRPESVSLTNGHNEPFIESNTESPIDDIKPQLSPHDPMTMGFVDGTPNTQNPFIEKTDDTNNDEMEIIHHDISTSDKNSMPIIEDIDPQGLPIENDIHSVKSTNKKSNNKSNR